MKKKILGIILSAIMLFGAVMSFGACKGKSDVTILFMANSAERAFYTKHFEEVASELGIKINFEGIPSEDYYDRLRKEINAGTTPDIIYVRSSNMRQYVAEGLIAPLDTYIAAQDDVDLSKIFPSAIECYQYDKATKMFGAGSQYALPKDLSVQQLGYNRTILQSNATAIAAAGLKMPWNMNWATENYTWEQFKQLAIICTDLSDDKNPIYGCDVPKLEIIAKSFGGQFLSDDMQNVTINTAAVKDAVKFQAEMIRDGAANYSGATYAAFTTGNVAFYGETNSYDIKTFDDTLGQNWGLMPWPVTAEQAPTDWKGLITSAGFAVTNGCSDKQRAVNIILTLLSQQTQDKLVKTEKLMLPLYKDIAEQAYSDSSFDDVYSPKTRGIYIDVISGKNGFFPTEYSTYDYLWYKDEFETYLTSIYGAGKDGAMGILKTDEQYAALQANMQQSYNANKAK